jgi:succinyl-diaminopimelate desuccinylase
LVGDQGWIDKLLDASAVATREDDPWVERVFSICERFLGERPRGRSATFFTDAAVLGPALGRPPTVICGPGDPAEAHQTDERVELSLIEKAVDLYVEIARDWLAYL